MMMLMMMMLESDDERKGGKTKTRTERRQKTEKLTETLGRRRLRQSVKRHMEIIASNVSAKDKNNEINCFDSFAESSVYMHPYMHA
jgi:hypothetical protein